MEMKKRKVMRNWNTIKNENEKWNKAKDDDEKWNTMKSDDEKQIQQKVMMKNEIQ
jgi:hypothetical protein